MDTKNVNVPLSLPQVPSESELREKIMNLQKLMGIVTEDEYNPLAPGGNDQELWPAQPAEAFTDFRLT